MSRTAGHAHGFLSSVLTWGCPRTWLGTAGGGRASRGPPPRPLGWAAMQGGTPRPQQMRAMLRERLVP